VAADDPAQAPVDGQIFYGALGCDVVHFGGDDTIGIGETVAFAAGNADFLVGMLSGR
jgi:hypothetical protein